MKNSGERSNAAVVNFTFDRQDSRITIMKFENSAENLTQEIQNLILGEPGVLRKYDLLVSAKI
jgi:hypothetical protein